MKNNILYIFSSHNILYIIFLFCTDSSVLSSLALCHRLKTAKYMFFFCRKLLDKANAWLRKSPDVCVKTCETVTWMSPDFKRLGDSEEMVLSKQLREKTSNYYARGLR